MLYFNIHWQVLVIIIYLNAFLLIKLLKTWVITHHIYWAPNVFQIFLLFLYTHNFKLLFKNWFDR